MLEQVPGIGVVLIGGRGPAAGSRLPQPYDHPAVASAIDGILAICRTTRCPAAPCQRQNVEGCCSELPLADGAADALSFAGLEARAEGVGPALAHGGQRTVEDGVP
jgi:hypothetical protein